MILTNRCCVNKDELNWIEFNLHGSSDVRSRKRTIVRIWAMWVLLVCTGLRKDQWWQGHVGREGWPRVVWSNRWAAGAPTAKEVHASSDRKVSGYTEHPSIAADQSGFPRWPLSTTSLLHHLDGRVCVRRMCGEHMTPRRQAGGTVWSFEQCSAELWLLWPSFTF